ncbi:uncharacterized protein LOC126682891 [Mercurialis annua]|uniref:uncharacterized protein LOC126682891 n=1 Tax=Mercurialis annua TaxID=3986 RepID=UPI0021601689|nr:uncharacterized protein LOC126682891 [Mercurialis annua]
MASTVVLDHAAAEKREEGYLILPDSPDRKKLKMDGDAEEREEDSPIIPDSRNPETGGDTDDEIKMDGDAEDYTSYVIDDDEITMDDLLPMYRTADNLQALKKYFDQIKESGGFDFDPYHGSPVIGGISPLDLGQDTIHVRGVKKALDFAIRRENAKRKDGDQLQLVRLIKSNYICGGTFYITFEAKSVDIQVYQAKVAYCVYGAIDEQTQAEVLLFRRKP